MEVIELKAKAEGIIQRLMAKLQEVEQQEQAIKAEICRYQGEIRVCNKMMEPKDAPEGESTADNVEKKEEGKGES